MEKSSDLPATVSLLKFAAARSKEIHLMKHCIATPTGTKMAFQKLPKHLRRRAMSHNVKRLPKRFREIHTNQMTKSGLRQKLKRPTRAYRRRPFNLLNDYARRKDNIKWLNTHIWHAKRFHMINKWGFRLPQDSCDHAFRACFRATKTHCLIQDISYFQCIEITGEFNVIVKNLELITKTFNGLSIAARAYLKGDREGSTTLFKYTKKDPTKAIGIIYFHWKPRILENDPINRTIWLWIHAAFYDEAVDTLKKCFNLTCTLELGKDKQFSSEEDNIEMQELGSQLNRFRLTGPLSTATIQNCFKPIEMNEVSSNTDNVANTYNLVQKESWNILNSMATALALSPNGILSLLIKDPRYHIPTKRTKSVPLEKSLQNPYFELFDNCSVSPIWVYNIRKDVNNSKKSNDKINELRKQLMKPGTEVNEKAVPIPILLVQRPGKRNQEHNGYGSGWDLILPAMWAQPIWLSLVMWGGKVGGLRETDSIAFEASQTVFLLPDTNAGAKEDATISCKHSNLFFSRPPNKRVNYTKLSVVSPFTFSWKQLIWDWSDANDGHFNVLRDEKLLARIQVCLSTNTGIDNLKKYANYLIPVSLKLGDKGVCKKFAMICLAKNGDLKRYPIEPLKTDPYQEQRKTLRKEHKDMLKALSKRKKRCKQNQKNDLSVKTDVVMEYKAKMRQLWLPTPANIRCSCSRQVIGFVTDGKFSFLQGQSTAVGYIAMAALPSLFFMKSKNNVLVRNNNSRYYKPAELSVIYK